VRARCPPLCAADPDGLTDQELLALGRWLPRLQRLELSILPWAVSSSGLEGLPAQLRALVLHGVLPLRGAGAQVGVGLDGPDCTPLMATNGCHHRNQ